ncbi:GntR family transcriptional regulator [Kocuria sp. CPCC 205263]|uniref:GntR family transcriptional regulator n=1 Tax=Kocuria sp. CPCC 205263 TaxID=3073555 RepID=UPI0034D5B63F
MNSQEPSAAGKVPAAELAYAALARHCRMERFRPGELIGSERALAEHLGIGRAVLRQAIERLEDEGTLRRVLGRSGGVFFHDGRIQRHLNTVEGVPQMVMHQGRTIATRVLGATMGLPLADEVRNLELTKDQPVLRIRRLRLVDEVPWSLDLSVLPSARFPGLLSHDLTNSLYHLLAGEYGLELDRAEETVEVTSATDEQAMLLAVDPAAALLDIRRVAWDVHRAPVEFAQDFFRADRTRIHMQNYGTNWKRTVRVGRY